jgi:hypothetical protein
VTTQKGILDLGWARGPWPCSNAARPSSSGKTSETTERRLPSSTADAMRVRSSCKTGTTHHQQVSRDCKGAPLSWHRQVRQDRRDAAGWLTKSSHWPLWQPPCSAGAAETTGRYELQGRVRKLLPGSPTPLCPLWYVAWVTISEAVMAVLDAKIAALLPHLNERQRRLFLAAEAGALGHGGIAAVARLAEVSVSTVARGRAELAGGASGGPGSPDVTYRRAAHGCARRR